MATQFRGERAIFEIYDLSKPWLEAMKKKADDEEAPAMKSMKAMKAHRARIIHAERTACRVVAKSHAEALQMLCPSLPGGTSLVGPALIRASAAGDESDEGHESNEGL